MRAGIHSLSFVSFARPKCEVPGSNTALKLTQGSLRVGETLKSRGRRQLLNFIPVILSPHLTLRPVRYGSRYIWQFREAEPVIREALDFDGQFGQSRGFPQKRIRAAAYARFTSGVNDDPVSTITGT